MVMNEWFINASVRTHTTSGDQDQSIQLALRHSPFGEFGHSVQFVTLEDTARSARAGIDVCDHQLGALTSFAMRCIAKVLPVTHRPLNFTTTYYCEHSRPDLDSHLRPLSRHCEPLECSRSNSVSVHRSEYHK